MNDAGPSDTELSPLKRALLAIEDMRVRVEAAERTAHEPIAILGIGCRMPGGANDPAAFWKLLDEGVDAIREIPGERWDMDDFYDPDPDVPGTIVSRDGGFIDDVDLFDPQFFGISPREAVTMDPQQRLLLEVSWEALEAAGVAPSSLSATKSGVYVGIGIFDYVHVAREGMESGALDLDAYVGTGNSASVAAGRISFALGLHGPAVAVDTACSSSLVSVHLACQALRAGEADLAIAGGVNLIFTPGTHIYMSQLRALSPTGRCRTFDASADGYVRSEGAAMIVLKRLSDAVADGDTVLAVIRGSAVNHDGRSSGLTVPNGTAQQAVIRAALEDGGIDPGDVSYVEAHGTGTPLGDPIEVRALDAVYGERRHEPLLIGSVKTNIGHLESASGIAGLLKVVLALQHDRIPAHLHLSQPTPHLAWDELAVEVPTVTRSWPRREQPRIGGVNSFGLSGTNSHVLISDPPHAATPDDASDETERLAHVLTLSARSRTALRELARNTAHALTEPDAPALPDAAYTLNTGRNAFSHRLAVVAATGAEAATALGRFADDVPVADLVARDLGTMAAPALAFLFTGQGSQYAGMGRELYAHEPTFRDCLNQCDAILRDHLDQPLLSVLHPAPGMPTPIDDTTYTQPALFALEYALAKMWHAWGVTPRMMLGHSIGGYVAAHLAGVLSLEDALVLVATRGRLMGSLPAGGSMASVFAPEHAVAEVVAAVGGLLSIAAINGPDNTVISGPDEEVRAAIERFAGIGIETRPLTTSHAFHSELMEPILAEFERVAAGVAMQPPHPNRMVSDMTGTVAGAEVASASYWVEHLRRAVRFADGVQTLAHEGCNVFLEVGPSPILSAMGRRCLPDAHAVWTATLQPKRPDVARTALALGELWTAGVDVSWAAFDRRFHRRRVVMPTAPFQRQRYWVPTSESRARGTALATGHGLLGSEVVAPMGPSQFEVGITPQRPAFIGDRVVHGRVELGGATFVESAFAAAREVWDGADALEVRGLVVDEPITVGSALRYSTTIEPQSRTVASVSVRVADMSGHSWNLAATAKVARVELDELARLVPPVFRPPHDETAIAATELYETWRDNGLTLGPREQCIEAMWSSATTATLRLTLPFGADRFTVYPPLVEVCALALVGGEAPRSLRGIERVLVVSDEPPVWCVRDLTAPDDDTLWFFDRDAQVVAVAGGFAFRDLVFEPAPPRAGWVYELTWRAVGDAPIPEGVRPVVASGTWLLVGSDERLAGIAAALAHRAIPVHRLDDAALSGADALKTAARVIDDALDAAPPLSHIVFAPSAGADVPTGAGASGRALLHLTQIVTEAAWRRRVAVPPQLWLVTRGAISVDGSRVTAPAEGALWGMLRTVGGELPQFYGGMIDLDPAGGDDDVVVELVTSSGDETWLARRGGDTHVARLGASPPDASRPGASFATSGAQLVTGGFGALGLATAHALVQRGARRVVLVGRSTVPPRASWSTLAADDPARARVDAIRALEASGATVHVASFDVADRHALASFLDSYRSEGWPPIRGVFHCAGVLRDRSVSDMTDDDVDTVFGPKVQGTWNLHELLADEPLDYFVLFASAAGLLGSPGQANYSAANAFMDSVAHLRRDQGRPALSIDWGAWAAGMADRDDLDRQRSRQGQLAIPVDAGMALMFDLLGTSATQALVMPMTRSQLTAAAASPLLSELVTTTDIASHAQERRDRGAEILASPAHERAPLMLEVLRTRVGAVLGLDADSVEPQLSLIELGLDSIMIVEMTTRLSIELGIGLNPREVFQEPSVQSLSATLLAALAHRAGGAPATDGTPSDAPLAGDGSVLVVGAPGSGIGAVRTALVAAAPSRVDGSTERPTAATLSGPAVMCSVDLATEPKALESLINELPGLRVIHLVRHPFSVTAELSSELGQRAAEEVWRTVNGDLLDLAERYGPERVRMVRLEDLIEGGAPVDALLDVVGAEREIGEVGAAPVLDGARLDDWRTVALDARPGRGLRQIADELGYDTTWPVPETVPTRGSGA